MKTHIPTFFADLDIGVFEKKLAHALSDVAAGVIDHSHAGKITITLDLKQIGNSQQVMVEHKLAFTRPTSKGKISEEDTTQTPMYVGEKGAMTIFPEGQGQLLDKHGAANPNL